MLKKAAACIILILLQFVYSQQSMPGVALPSFRSLKPPSPPNELLASSHEDGKIKLTWTLSSSADVGAYNIYSDNGTGTIDYDTPIATVDHTVKIFVTPPLKNSTTYRFGIRAVSTNDIEEKNTSVNSSAVSTDSISKVGNITGTLKKMKEVTGDSEVSIIADVRIGDLEERRVMKEKENIEDISLRLTNKKRKVEEIGKQMKEINTKLLNDRKDLDSIKDELSLDREMLGAPNKIEQDRSEKKKVAKNLMEYSEKLADKENDINRMLTELMDLKTRSESEEVVADTGSILKQAKERIVQVQSIAKEISEENESLKQFKQKTVKTYPELLSVLSSSDAVNNRETLPKQLPEEIKEQLDVLVEKVEEVRKKITETGSLALKTLKEKDLTLPEYKELKESIIDPSFERLDKMEEIRKRILEEKNVVYLFGNKTGIVNNLLEIDMASKKTAELSKVVKEIEKEAASGVRNLDAKKSSLEERAGSTVNSEVYTKLDELEAELKNIEIQRVEVVKKRNILAALEENIIKAEETANLKDSGVGSKKSKATTSTAAVSVKKEQTAGLPPVFSEQNSTASSAFVTPKTEEQDIEKASVVSTQNKVAAAGVPSKTQEKDNEDASLVRVTGVEEEKESLNPVRVKAENEKSEKKNEELTGKRDGIKNAISKIDELLSNIDNLRKEALAKLPEAIKGKEEESIVASMRLELDESPAENRKKADLNVPGEKSNARQPEKSAQIKNIGLKLDEILNENKASIESSSKLAKEMTIADIRKEKNVGVDEKVKEVAIRLSEGAINFDYNKAELRPVYFKLLNKIVKYLALNPENKVRVEGHTCYIGSDEYNKALSKKRAAAVVEYFIKRGRLPPDNFSYAGLGKEKPVASNETETGRQKNRRVEIIIEK